MRAGAGASVIWKGRLCTILVVSASQVTVRDGEGAEFEVERGEFESTVRRAVPVTRRLASYLRDLDEGPVAVAWLAAVEVVLAAGPGQRKATITEQAAALPTSLGKPVSARTLKRKLRAFQEKGRPGLRIIVRLIGAGERGSRRTPPHEAGAGLRWTGQPRPVRRRCREFGDLPMRALQR